MTAHPFRKQSRLAQTDGAVAGGNAQQSAPAIQFPTNGVAVRVSFQLKRNPTNINATIASPRIDVGLQIVRNGEIDPAIAGMNPPGAGHFRPGQGAHCDRAIASVDIEAVETALDRDPGVSIEVNLRRQFSGSSYTTDRKEKFNRSVRRPQNSQDRIRDVTQQPQQAREKSDKQNCSQDRQAETSFKPVQCHREEPPVRTCSGPRPSA